MKATGLMIGDILNLSDNDKDIIPCKVVELHTEELLVIQPRDTACDIVGYDMVRPMLLTPEILENNGFENEIGNRWIYRTNVTVYFPSYRTEIDNDLDSVVCHSRSVHELQHTLRLCGLDELADNFQI